MGEQCAALLPHPLQSRQALDRCVLQVTSKGIGLKANSEKQVQGERKEKPLMRSEQFCKVTGIEERKEKNSSALYYFYSFHHHRVSCFIFTSQRKVLFLVIR